VTITTAKARRFTTAIARRTAKARRTAIARTAIARRIARRTAIARRYACLTTFLEKYVNQAFHGWSVNLETSGVLT